MRTLFNLGLAALLSVALVAVAGGAEKRPPRQHNRGAIAGIAAPGIEGAKQIGKGLWKHRPAWLFHPPAAPQPSGVDVQPGTQAPMPATP